jgi:hypothetical protein
LRGNDVEGRIVSGPYSPERDHLARDKTPPPVLA